MAQFHKWIQVPLGYWKLFPCIVHLNHSKKQPWLPCCSKIRLLSTTCCSTQDLSSFKTIAWTLDINTWSRSSHSWQRANTAVQTPAILYSELNMPLFQTCLKRTHFHMFSTSVIPEVRIYPISSLQKAFTWAKQLIPRCTCKFSADDADDGRYYSTMNIDLSFFGIFEGCTYPMNPMTCFLHLLGWAMLIFCHSSSMGTAVGYALHLVALHFGLLHLHLPDAVPERISAIVRIGWRNLGDQEIWEGFYL